MQDFLGANDYVLEQTMFDGFAKMPLIGAPYIVTPDCYLGAVSTWDPTKASRSMSLSPNPATTHTEVLFKSESAFEARLTLHSLGGQLLFGSKTKVQTGTNLFYLQLQHLPPATYFVRLEHGQSGRAEVVKLAKI